jgi:hypothetical protein
MLIRYRSLRYRMLRSNRFDIEGPTLDIGVPRIQMTGVTGRALAAASLTDCRRAPPPPPLRKRPETVALIPTWMRSLTLSHVECMVCPKLEVCPKTQTEDFITDTLKRWQV